MDGDQVQPDKCVARVTNLYNIFLEQKYDENFFDIIFDVSGKPLYAHAVVLSAASPVFNEILLKRHREMDEPQKQTFRINEYDYDDFFEFLKLVYTPYDIIYIEERLLYQLVKLADYYQIESVKEVCDINFNRHIPIPAEMEAIFSLLCFADKHSLKIFKKRLQLFVNQFLPVLVEYEGFQNLDKNAIVTLAKYINKEKMADEFCNALYRVPTKIEEIYDLNNEEEKNFFILSYIKKFIEFMPFEKMSFNFLLQFCVPRNIITLDEACKRKLITVSITYKYGTALSKAFVDSYGIYELIEIKDKEPLPKATKMKMKLWNQIFAVPNFPSTVTQNESFEWYLLLDAEGFLSIKHSTLIESSDYLIAEMEVELELEFEDDHFLIDNFVYDYFAKVARTV